MVGGDAAAEAAEMERAWAQGWGGTERTTPLSAAETQQKQVENFARRSACFTCGEARPFAAAPLSASSAASIVITSIEAHVSESALTFAIAELGGPGCAVKGLRLVRSRDPACDWKGFAFVELFTPDAARRTLAALDGSTLNGCQGRRVRASLARPGTVPPPSTTALPLASQWPAPDDAVGVAADASGWQPAEFGEPEPGEVASEAVAQEPAAAGPSSGFVFQPHSGYFVDAASGYFYDPATRMYGQAATGTWFNYDAATGVYTAVGAAVEPPPAEAAAPPPPAARSGAVIGSAPKLSAEAIAVKEAEARRVKEAEEAEARKPKSTPVAGGRVYGGRMRAPRLPPPPPPPPPSAP